MPTNFVMSIYTRSVRGHYVRLATAETYAASRGILPVLAKLYTGLFCLYARGPMTIAPGTDTAKRLLPYVPNVEHLAPYPPK